MSVTGVRRLQILLVDDDPLVVKVYAERMRYAGWNVEIARDGWDACTEASKATFDMILLDLLMPLHDGLSVLKKIRQSEANAGTPVYILTSMEEGEEVLDALRLGADGVFYKARVRPEQLVEQVEAILSPGGRGDRTDEDAPAAESAAPAAPCFEVYINPLLGDGGELGRALGLREPFLCPTCGGAVGLRLTPAPEFGESGISAAFFCGRCDD